MRRLGFPMAGRLSSGFTNGGCLILRMETHSLRLSSSNNPSPVGGARRPPQQPPSSESSAEATWDPTAAPSPSPAAPSFSTKIGRVGDLTYQALDSVLTSVNQTASQFSQQESQERHADKALHGTWRTPAATKNVNYDNAVKNQETGDADRTDRHQNILLLAVVIVGCVVWVVHYVTYGHVVFTTKPDDQRVFMMDYLGTDYAYFQRRFFLRFTVEDFPLLGSVIVAIKGSSLYQSLAAVMARSISDGDTVTTVGTNVSKLGEVGKTVFVTPGSPESPCFRHSSDMQVLVVKDPYTNQHVTYPFKFNRILYHMVPFRAEKELSFKTTVGRVLRENMLTFQTHGRLERAEAFEMVMGNEEEDTSYWNKPNQGPKNVSGGGTVDETANRAKIFVSVKVRPYSGKDVVSEQILNLRLEDCFSTAMKMHVFEAVRALSHARQKNGSNQTISERSEKKRKALTEEMMRSGAISSLDLSGNELLESISTGAVTLSPSSLNQTMENGNPSASAATKTTISREQLEQVEKLLAADVHKELDRRAYNEYLVSSVAVKIQL